MVTPEFTFEALLAYSRKKHTKKEVKRYLEFIRDFTLEINDIDLSKLKYGGAFLN